MRRVPPGARWFFVVLGLALAYVVAGRIGLQFTSLKPGVSVVWPPTGLALAALLVFGLRTWPGVFIGAWVLGLQTTGSIPGSFAVAAGATIEALLGAWFVERFANGRFAFRTPDGVFAFAVLAGVLATLVGATVSTLGLTAAGWIEPAALREAWLTWWMGDLTGALILGPPMIMLSQPLEVRWDRRRVIEAAVLTVVGLVATQAVFGNWPFSLARLGFLCAPPLLWAAFRFGRRGASLGVVFLSAYAIASTLEERGPFAVPGGPVFLLPLQVFLAVLSVTTLAIAATVSGRRMAEASVRALNDELEERIAERTAQLEAAVQQLRGEIAERVHAEEERRTGEARLLEAQRIGHIGSWEWNVAADALWWSDEMYRIYGVDAGAPLTYEVFLGAVHPEDRERVDGILKRAFKDGGPFGFEHRIIRPDGEVRTVYSQGRLVCDERGEPLRMLGTGQDITERKRADDERSTLHHEQLLRQEAEEANRRKDEFLAILSHELRTPISSITLWAHLLREGALDEPTTRRAVDVIDRNARIQGRLISDILDIARLDTGKLNLNAQPVRIPEAIEAAIDAVRPLAEERGVTVTARMEPALPEVAGDADRLQQVVWNLLANAVKFAPSGGGAVEVRAATDGDEVEIEVWDDGPGIDPEFLPYIFDPFRQDDSSTTRRHGGLGLGLAIVKRLVDLHHGTVAARNRIDGSGSVFSIRLPAMAPEADMLAAGNGSAKAGVPALRTIGGLRTGPPRLSGIQVLVVDDEVDARDVLSTALTAYGADVMTCSSAAEALDAIEEHPFDVLVSDIAMPEEDGCTFISRVRSLGGSGAAIPAVALTAFASDDYVNRALEAGFQAHVAKPVEADEIATIVARLASGVLSPVAPRRWAVGSGNGR
jgi:PAS domain S-box-containing protein